MITASANGKLNSIFFFTFLTPLLRRACLSGRQGVGSEAPNALILLLISLFFFNTTTAQLLTNARQKFISTKTDTAVIDTLSIVPGSANIYCNHVLLDTSCFSLDEIKSVLVWKRNSVCMLSCDSVLITYRVFPLLFSQTFRHKDKRTIEKEFISGYNPVFAESKTKFDPFRLQGLNRSGSISRGITFGNNQDVVVNSSLNLQLSGKLSDDVEILAAISDNNIPVQPEGNTQQLQEFDKVFIQLTRFKSRLLAGDFELVKPPGYFMNYFKKAQGGLFSTEFSLHQKKKKLMRLNAAAAVSRGKFARNTFTGTEGNQGPYRLTGAENESFIVILSGTERIFLDGLLLTRGQENDYIIDYNTAELFFTPRRIITKDSRIVTEFQYSEKSYSRSMISFSDEYETEKLKVRVNVFSEQDSKNQPLQQDLDTEQKTFLASIGDSIHLAYTLNADSVAFNTNEVLYAKRDTITGTDTTSIFVYSVSPDSAHWRVGFSNVGANKGNYVQVNTIANGRVYQWTAPVSGIPQGSYEPVVLLITPRKQQMATAGIEYKVSEQTSIGTETAVSSYDVNRFSSKDKADNTGYALKVFITRGTTSSRATSQTGWKFSSRLDYELVEKNFRQIENFRPVEFTRDWNLSSISAKADEHLAGVSLGISKPKQDIGYRFRSFLKGDDFRGFMNTLLGHAEIKSLKFLWDGSYLITQGNLSKTNFARGKADLSNAFGKIVLGTKPEFEHNEIFFPETDSLQLSSFDYRTWQVYLRSVDTLRYRFLTSYSQRYDFAVKNNSFNQSVIADNASVDFSFQPSTNNRIGAGAVYRKVTVKDSLLSFAQPDDYIVGRTEINYLFLKGAIRTLTFYEIGTGREPKKEYAFIEVPAGTGAYQWIDYNANSIKELNEFEIAAFTTDANYIKILIPSTEYVSVNTNRLSFTLELNPAAYFISKGKQYSLPGRFSALSSFRFDNKTLESDFAKSANPFIGETIDDVSLISTNSSIRNTVFYNRSSSAFAADATWLELKNKALLANGFESRSSRALNSSIRSNITSMVSVQVFTEVSEKTSSSEFLPARNFNIEGVTAEPRIIFQPGTAWRISFIYSFTGKRNTPTENSALTKQHNGGVEFKFSSVQKGFFTAKFNYIRIGYNAPENTPLAYEMLNGLRKGENFTWNVSLQRSLSQSLQLSLTYEGRKPQDVKTIHTGGVQVKAFF